VQVPFICRAFLLLARARYVRMQATSTLVKTFQNKRPRQRPLLAATALYWSAEEREKEEKDVAVEEAEVTRRLASDCLFWSI
jgi:hypothetical protein